jgi:hypothetical protein
MYKLLTGNLFYDGFWLVEMAGNDVYLSRYRNGRCGVYYRDASTDSNNLVSQNHKMQDSTYNPD